MHGANYTCYTDVLAEDEYSDEDYDQAYDQTEGGGKKH
jgi:hypothetical protein